LKVNDRSPKNQTSVPFLGEAADALDWLDHAVEDRDPEIVLLPCNPLYDHLHSEPNFVRLLQKMRLPCP